MASENLTATPKIGTPAKAAKIPRPPNAFILYRQHHRPMVKEAHPDFHNNDICMDFCLSSLLIQQGITDHN